MANLKSMSREEKEALLQAIQERKRREKSKKPPFVPNEGQLSVLQSDKLIRVVTSGNGSGKTVLAVVEAVNTCLGVNPFRKVDTPVPTKVIYVLDKPSKVNDKIVVEMKRFYDTSEWVFHKDGTPGIRRVSFPNGSEMVFMFHEQEAMSFESVDSYSSCAYDEPPPRHVFIGLARGGRSKGYKTRHLFCGTPIGPNASWLRTELLEQWKAGDPDIEVFNFSTHVNSAHLDDGYIESFSKRLTEKEIQVRLHGQWSDLDGLALAHLWRDDKHLTKGEYAVEKEWPTVIAIDPHPTKAHCVLALTATPDDRLVAIDFAERKEVPRDFARFLRKWMERFRVIDIVVDNLGSSEMTGGEGFKSFIQVLNEEGVRARPTTYDEKSDEDWITRIQDALLIPDTPDNFGQMEPKLKVHPRCRTLISDIKNAQWVKIRNQDLYKPTLDISNKDALACLKYALATGLFYAKPQRMRPHYMNVQPYRGLDLKPKRRARLSVRR